MIRPMEYGDLNMVVDIWFTSNCSAHHFVPVAYWESHLDYMLKALSHAEVWVYCVGERVVAFVGVDGDYIAGLFVAEGFRSQGIGHALLDHVKTLHRSLSLCVYEKNPQALAFYTREGFAAIAHRVDAPTAEEEIVMRWVE